MKEKNPKDWNRFELFWDTFNDQKMWQEFDAAKTSYNNDFLKSFEQIITEFTIKYLKNMRSKIPTEKEYIKHNNLLVKHLDNKARLSLVAHSQGNLFVNQARSFVKDYIKKKDPTMVFLDYVQVIHVAPPTSKIDDLHVLASRDLVILPLDSPRVTHDLPLRALFSDWQGHSFNKIYMNKSYPPRSTIISYLDYKIKMFDNLLKPDTASPKTNFMKARLSWNTKGDISDADLHIYEPDGTHLYYAKPRSSAGTFKRLANGTFNDYLLSCDKSKVQTGTYQFKITNSRSIQSNSAILMIYDFENRILGSKSISLSHTTRTVPTTILNVNILQNSNGSFDIQIDK